MLKFIKTTVLGGIIFLVPVVIFIAIVAKGLEIANKLAAPLAEVLPVHSVGDLAIVHLLALTILILICFISGLVVRTSQAKRLIRKQEAGSRRLGQDPGLCVEESQDRQRTDARGHQGHAPGAPDPWSGSVCAVTSDRLSPLDINIRTAGDLMRRLGKGTTASLRTTLTDAARSAPGN
jgi:uncharacterized membrane protein